MSIKLTFLGHSTFQIETAEHSILVDPFLTGNPQANVSADDVSADFITLTHGHGDHVGDTVAIAKRIGAKVIANFEICEWLGKQGLTNVHPQHIGGGFNHEFGRLKLTTALHGSMLPDGSNGGMPAGLLFTIGDVNIYHAGDTGLFSDMQLIGEAGIDIAILPIGDNFTMGPDDALRAVKFLNPKQVVPCHYNTFGYIEQDANAWAERVGSETSADATVMDVGQTLEIS
jgi:L-ascorbate metabolism protein UlaG (beta-lactamase superfamily)